MKPYYVHPDGTTIYHGNCCVVTRHLRNHTRDYFSLWLDPPMTVRSQEDVYDILNRYDLLNMVALHGRVLALTNPDGGYMTGERYQWRMPHTIKPVRLNGMEPNGVERPQSRVDEVLVKSGVSIGGYTILDPFMGTGTTLVAAHKFGIRAVGIDIEERNCEVAANKLTQSLEEFPGRTYEAWLK